MTQGPRPLGSSHRVLRSSPGVGKTDIKKKGPEPQKRASPKSAALESVVQHRPPPPPRRPSVPPPEIPGLYAPGSRASTPPPPPSEEERIRLEAVRAAVARERQAIVPPKPKAKPSKTPSTKAKPKKEPADREHPDYGATTKLTRREMRERSQAEATAKAATKAAEETAAAAAAASPDAEEPSPAVGRGAHRKGPLYVRPKPSNGAPAFSSR